MSARQALRHGLQVDVLQMEGYPCIRLRGEGGCDSAPTVSRVFERLMDSGYRRLMLDMREMRFMEPGCYEALKDAVLTVDDQGGVLAIVDDGLPVERTLKLLDLDRLAHVVPSPTQAAAWLSWHE